MWPGHVETDCARSREDTFEGLYKEKMGDLYEREVSDVGNE